MWSAIMPHAGVLRTVGGPCFAPFQLGPEGGSVLLQEAAASAAGRCHSAGCADPTACSADASGCPELPGSCPWGCVWC